MGDSELVAYVKDRLNELGRPWNLVFRVSNQVRPDGDWVQVMVKGNADATNRAAERQIISDVEEEITERSGKEVLLVVVNEIEDAA